MSLFSSGFAVGFLFAFALSAAVVGVSVWQAVQDDPYSDEED